MFSAFCKQCSTLTKIPEQMIRFLCVGVMNTAFAYGLYALFIFLGLHYAAAVLGSTLIGICFSFKTFGKWVFFNTDNRRLIRFFAVYGGCYFINVGLLKMLTEAGLDNWYAAGLISSLIVAGISFVLNKFFVFSKK